VLQNPDGVIFSTQKVEIKNQAVFHLFFKSAGPDVLENVREFLLTNHVLKLEPIEFTKLVALEKLEELMIHMR
jgi:hypothetical protein